MPPLLPAPVAVLSISRRRATSPADDRRLISSGSKRPAAVLPSFSTGFLDAPRAPADRTTPTADVAEFFHCVFPFVDSDRRVVASKDGEFSQRAGSFYRVFQSQQTPWRRRVDPKQHLFVEKDRRDQDALRRAARLFLLANDQRSRVEREREE